MYVAPGLLDQRLRLYTREDAGADGFQRPVYVYAGEFWGRIDETASNQNVSMSPQAHVEARSDAVAFLSEEAPVDAFGILRVDNLSPIYWVRGIVKNRAVRLQRVTLQAINPTDFAQLTVYESDDVLDGVHLVAPTNAFSTGFSEGFA
jgi:hypothetical protein